VACTGNCISQFQFAAMGTPIQAACQEQEMQEYLPQEGAVPIIADLNFND
jgi:hypothetical protein